jgi:hypothetical protein
VTLWRIGTKERHGARPAAAWRGLQSTKRSEFNTLKHHLRAAPTKPMACHEPSIQSDIRLDDRPSYSFHAVELRGGTIAVWPRLGLAGPTNATALFRHT